MPSLSHKRLHGRAVILRALTAAGQFAHVPVENFSPHLDDLYNINTRIEWARKRDARAKAAELAVPLAFVKAHQTGLFDGHWYDAETVNYVSLLEGVTCCLCADTQMRVGGAYCVPRDLITHICPTFLRGEGLTRDDRQPPLCAPCQCAIAGRIWRMHGMHEPENRPEFWGEILAWLAANKTFRERVETNAHLAAKLRFDPRHIQFPPLRRKAA